MVWIIQNEAELAAIKELNEQSARAAAIVGATILESRIELVVRTMFPREGKTKEALFSPRGRLGEFMTKVELAYAFGIITAEALQDMKLIGEIRNMFAHRLEISDFDHDELRAQCAKFQLIEKHVFPYGTPEATTPEGLSPKLYEPLLEGQLASPRKRYLLSIRLLCGALHIYPAVHQRPVKLIPRI